MSYQCQFCQQPLRSGSACLSCKKFYKIEQDAPSPEVLAFAHATVETLRDVTDLAVVLQERIVALEERVDRLERGT